MSIELFPVQGVTTVSNVERFFVISTFKNQDAGISIWRDWLTEFEWKFEKVEFFIYSENLIFDYSVVSYVFLRKFQSPLRAIRTNQ